MIPEAEISRNYYLKIYQKDYTFGKLSEQKLFPDCQVLVSGNSKRWRKSIGTAKFPRIIQKLPPSAGKAGNACITSGKGQQKAEDREKTLKLTYQTDGHCMPMYNTLTYVITTAGLISKFQARQFYKTQGRLALV
jgi:hypothetical protein